MQNTRADTTIIGGGVVGLSIALGLLRAGEKIHVLDGADHDPRASLGNFGLTWLQGKGASYAPYTRRTWQAITAWPDFAATLQDLSGIDVAHHATGGYEFFTDPDELDGMAADLAAQSNTLGPGFSYEVLDNAALKQALPGIGDTVIGATYTPHDGHVNPLRLLSALRKALQNGNGRISNGWVVQDIRRNGDDGFTLTNAKGDVHQTGRVVLCAGLGAAALGERLGFRATVRPQRGELLITEKLETRLPFLSSTLRQVDEGGIQIGGTKSDGGLDDREAIEKMRFLARHAVAVWPALKDVNVVRSWGALRVMTEDGYPVYARAPDGSEAYLVTCHSGVTLAPLHATLLADWINQTSAAPDLEAFSDARF
ncbi:FAD-dependent oxidoreductase [Shimia sp. SDUM112013]|uniref:NAD(P)/FAD-dependent oxidoreductase n=1 Tax=Shimia sp. SDUM112013 TaxID=3136160 RepID=UPI0032EC5E83